MRASIVRIGNSQGLRIPKSILQACGIEHEVELSIEADRLVIARPRSVRSGWAEAAQSMASKGDDELLDPPTATEFDADEWEW